MSFLQNLPDFSLLQKNYEGIFEFHRKWAFIWYKNISCSIIFSQHHERIQIFQFFQKIMIFQHFLKIFEKKAVNPKRHPKFFWIFKVYNIKKNWGDVVRREYPLRPCGRRTNSLDLWLSGCCTLYVHMYVPNHIGRSIYSVIVPLFNIYVINFIKQLLIE